MFQDALAGLESQVQAVVSRVTLFKRINDAQALQVVLKPGTVGVAALQAGIESVLPGMAKRGVAQIVGQCNRFNQVFIEPQAAGNGPPQLRDLQRMRQPGAKQITFVV